MLATEEADQKLKMITIENGLQPFEDSNSKIADQEVTATVAIIYLELGLLALIPLMGSLMARGFGYGW